MKTLIKTTGFIANIAIFLLLTACMNPFAPPESGAPENGEAYVTIKMGNGDNARTLYPTFAFDKYALQFTPGAGQAAVSPVTITSGISATVALAHGSWTVTAIGYVTINGADEEAARGTGALNVQAGSNSLTIELQPQKEEGEGFLSYDISFPTVSTASLKILSLLGDTPIEEKDLNAGASGTITLDAGFYVLRLELKKADGGKIAKMEVIHIYHGLTTEASRANYTFTDDDFSYIVEVTFIDAEGNTIYTETAARGALISGPGDQAVGVGEGLYLDFDPAGFEGWADDSDNLYDFSAPVTNDITLTAKWSTTPPSAIPLSGTGSIVNQAVTYVNANATAGAYTLFLGDDYTVAGSSLTATDADLTIIGLEEERTLQWDGTNSQLFSVNGPTALNVNTSLTLGNHITLKGTSGGQNNLVQIRSGTLTMEEGSKITGHTQTSSGGTVYVVPFTSYGTATTTGTFIMNGGEITGNKTTYATQTAVGGVYVTNFGSVVVNGGRITGNFADTGAAEYPSDIFVAVSTSTTTACEGNLTLSGAAEIGAIKLDGAYTQAPSPYKSSFITLDNFTPTGVTVIDLRRDISSTQAGQNATLLFGYWANGTRPVLQAASDTLTSSDLNNFTLGKFFGYDTFRRYINGNPSSVGNYQLTLNVNEDSAVLEKDETETKGTPRTADFTVTGLVQGYDGSPKTVTITPKAGMSDGAITIYYNGSTNAPSAAGTYTVTFDVAEGTNYYAATGFSAGTLDIAAPVTITTNADSGPGSLREAIDGKKPAVIIAPGVGTIELASRLVITGDITIAGNGATITRNASKPSASNADQLMQVTGGAAVTISRVHFKDSKSTDYGAIYVFGATGARVTLTLESCVISGSRTTGSNYATGGAMYAITSDVTLKGCTFYDNSLEGTSSNGGFVSLGGTTTTLNFMGNLFYGNTASNNSVMIHSSAGGNVINSLGYNIIDVPFGTGSGQSGWASGTLGDDTFSNLGIVGLPFSDTIFEPQSGLNEVIEYTLSGFPATDFNGTVRTVPGAPGAINSGNYIFAGYTVVAGDFDITGLSQNLINGAPQAVSITPRANKSPGDITIYYEGTGGTSYGKSTTAPSAEGTYAVTFDVAAAPGFLAATGLVAGTLNITAPVALTDGTWVYDTLAVSTDEHWYSFPVENGTSYYVWVDEKDRGGSSTGDTVVGARYAGASTWIFGGTDNSQDNANPQTINANQTGTVQVRVIPYSRSATYIGTYGIVFSTTNSKPALP